MTSPISMQSPEILTLGEPLIEFNQTTPLGKHYLQGFGGDVSTVAVAASRFGARSGIISRVGSDQFGELLLDLWRQEHVDSQFVLRDPTAPTGVYFVSHSETGHRFSYLRSGSAASRITPEQLPLTAISSARWLHVSAISQAISESSSNTVSAAITAARAAGTFVSYDPNLRLALWPLERARQTIRSTVALADLFLPSLEDIVTLSEATSPDQALEWCIAAGARQIVLKLGARGALAYIDGKKYEIQPHRVSLVDATGAGDCFAGVLLASLCAGEAMQTAMTHANTAAALATTGYGAVAPLPTRDQVMQVLSSRTLESSHVG